jgi:hypothetical protein
MDTQKKKEEAKVRDLQPTKDPKGGARIDPHGPPGSKDGVLSTPGISPLASHQRMT